MGAGARSWFDPRGATPAVSAHAAQQHDEQHEGKQEGTEHEPTLDRLMTLSLGKVHGCGRLPCVGVSLCVGGGLRARVRVRVIGLANPNPNPN